MMECSLVKNLEIVAGDIEDYRRLSVYHYRNSSIGPYESIFAIKAVGKLAGRMGNTPVGVIVYSMPTAGLELRNVALGGILTGLGRRDRLSFLNKNVRTISRVVIEPRFRSLGLATGLVRETIERIGVPIAEALAVMGQVNGFFEKAGMTAYKGATALRTAQLIEAFGFAGISEDELIDAEAVQERINNLSEDLSEFIDEQIRSFLLCYGRRRDMPAGIERMRFVLSRLTDRPIYYIKIKNRDRAFSVPISNIGISLRSIVKGEVRTEKWEGRRVKVQNTIQAIAIDKLIANPLNANRMSEQTFKKLLRNIERTGRYEPIVVRKHPEIEGSFQIINGHHRCKALKELGYKKADCVVWDVDDNEMALLLATLNRLAGSDVLDKKVVLLARLRQEFGAGELAKLLPHTKKQIEQLANLKAPDKPVVGSDISFARPLVFFVSDQQLKIIDGALSAAMKNTEAGLAIPYGGATAAQRKAEALAIIAEHYSKYGNKLIVFVEAPSVVSRQ